MAAANQNNNNNDLLLTSNQMFRRGCKLVGIPLTGGRMKKAGRIELFKSFFGKHPNQLATVWNDLMTTTIVAARVDRQDVDLKGFFAALTFLKIYDKEHVRRVHFKMEEKSLRELTWFWVTKIAALKALKIVWPEDDEWKTTFIISVDGTHFQINEPRNPTYKKHPQNYSHKFNTAGINHEIGIHLFEQRCVHAKVWDYASKQDKTIFKIELQQKIPAGKRVICDNGYEGVPSMESAYNQFDTEAVKAFKKRAKARHESFNGRLKNFACMDTRFRHGIAKHQLCFDAVVVLTQYSIEDVNPESGEPLFDI